MYTYMYIYHIICSIHLSWGKPGAKKTRWQSWPWGASLSKARPRSSGPGALRGGGGGVNNEGPGFIGFRVYCGNILG